MTPSVRAISFIAYRERRFVHIGPRYGVVSAAGLEVALRDIHYIH